MIRRSGWIVPGGKASVTAAGIVPVARKLERAQRWPAGEVADEQPIIDEGFARLQARAPARLQERHRVTVFAGDRRVAVEDAAGGIAIRPLGNDGEGVRLWTVARPQHAGPILRPAGVDVGGGRRHGDPVVRGEGKAAGIGRDRRPPLSKRLRPQRCERALQRLPAAVVAHHEMDRPRSLPNEARTVDPGEVEGAGPRAPPGGVSIKRRRTNRPGEVDVRLRCPPDQTGQDRAARRAGPVAQSPHQQRGPGLAPHALDGKGEGAWTVGWTDRELDRVARDTAGPRAGPRDWRGGDPFDDRVRPPGRSGARGARARPRSSRGR